jgi:thioredoxin 1
MAHEKFNDIIQGEKPVLVDFHATWCGPCKMMAPVIQQIAAEFGDKVRVLKIDVDRNPQVSEAYQIQGVPTFILFKNGAIKWRQSGAMPRHHLESILQQHL